MARKESETPIRDLSGLALVNPDPIVVRHVKDVMEFLQEHMEAPTLNTYQRFLKEELRWLSNERIKRQELRKPLP